MFHPAVLVRNACAPTVGALAVPKSFRFRVAKSREKRIFLRATFSDAHPSPYEDLDVFGFSEEWEVAMVRFWRAWNVTAVSQHRHKVREADIADLVKLGRTESFFANPETVHAASGKLASLLPDAHVPNMFAREPGLIHLNFAKAATQILTLQQVLCDAEKCTDVTGVLERHPKLLLCADVKREVELAVLKLQKLAPDCDANKAVSEYPELIYRILAYDEYANLPVSIMNIISETSAADVREKISVYDNQWDEWERLSDAGFKNAESPDDRLVNSDHALDPFDAESDASQWMNDGVWEEED